MLEKLKEIYPSIIEAKADIAMDTETYDWYSTNDNKIIGIPKQALTKNESILLDTFLTPYYANQPPVTQREEQWINVLFNGSNTDELTKHSNTAVRFVYFSLSDDSIDPVSFREAIHGLFPNRVPILWDNNHEGVIIEENINSDDEIVSYLEIIDVLMSDFYMKVHLYIGTYFHNIKLASDYYQWTKNCYHTVHQYDKKSVISYIQAVPYLLMDHLEERYSSYLIHSILQETEQEEELLETIQVFLECNSNATLTAKKLYMHRNSLQYRVDKFIEKTGIDVKQFEGALSVYLILLLRNKKKQDTL